jgi:hypothetical protein
MWGFPPWLPPPGNGLVAVVPTADATCGWAENLLAIDGDNQTVWAGLGEGPEPLALDLVQRFTLLADMDQGVLRCEPTRRAEAATCPTSAPGPLAQLAQPQPAQPFAHQASSPAAATATRARRHRRTPQGRPYPAASHPA